MPDPSNSEPRPRFVIPEIEFGFITPSTATDLLETDHDPLDLDRVRAITEDIRSGRWEINGASVVINQDGDVVDGRHRLAAIRDAGVGVHTVYVRGVNCKRTR